MQMIEVIPLHDATFEGILTTGHDCVLHFLRTDGTRCEVRLGQVQSLQMNDFREGNIVVHFETTKGETPRGSIDWERLFPSPHPDASEQHQVAYADYLKARILDVESGSLTFVEMVPAYGADLLAACQTVTVREALA